MLTWVEILVPGWATERLEPIGNLLLPDVAICSRQNNDYELRAIRNIEGIGSKLGLPGADKLLSIVTSTSR
jgi:hypothetical protein